MGSLLTCRPLAMAIPSARQISSAISDHIRQADLTTLRCPCRRFVIVLDPSFLFRLRGPNGQGWLAWANERLAWTWDVPLNQLLRLLYLGQHRNTCVPEAGHLGLIKCMLNFTTETSLSTPDLSQVLGLGHVLGLGGGRPRVWVGQPLIISCPVVTWQLALVSQAGLPIVSSPGP